MCVCVKLRAADGTVDRGGGLPTLNSCQTRQVACDERLHFAALPPFSSRAASAATEAAEAEVAGAAGARLQLGRRREGTSAGKGDSPADYSSAFLAFFSLGMWAGEWVGGGGSAPLLQLFSKLESVRYRAVRTSITFLPPNRFCFFKNSAAAARVNRSFRRARCVCVRARVRAKRECSPPALSLTPALSLPSLLAAPLSRPAIFQHSTRRREGRRGEWEGGKGGGGRRVGT